MIALIHEYFRQTGRKVPELLPAVIFAQTELGETFDAIMRSGMVGEGWLRNNERASSIEIELADTYMMILLAAAAIEVDLDAVLTEKMLRKGWKPDPWLQHVWQQAFPAAENGAEAAGNPDSQSGFPGKLWQHCIGLLAEAGEDPRADLAADLRKQRTELETLIQLLEGQDGV